jgi:hypothetical protein
MATDLDYWAKQSGTTEPGKAGEAIDKLDADISALREASSQLVFHYRAGDFTKEGVPKSRMPEIHTRYAEDMLDLILSRGEPSLSRQRPGLDRFVGCCRDAAVLFLTLARHKGIPARARVGFASYIISGWWIDHVIAEVWDVSEQRWRLVDPEMEASYQPEVNGRKVDWTDLQPDQFATGPQAWVSARAGTSDPEKYVVNPKLDLTILRGWPYIAHHVLHDLACLNKTEMLLWDAWGLELDHDHGLDPVSDADAIILDQISAITSDTAVDTQAIAKLTSQDGLHVPTTVTQFDPFGAPPKVIDVQRALSG